MSRAAVRAVVFDVDGCLLDSAPGIVAGFRHALITMGIQPPSDEVLGADLGPPVDQVLLGFGVPGREIFQARQVYWEFYRQFGVQQAVPYLGVVELLKDLRDAGVRLGTATAKRTDTAELILTRHGLARYFDVINGSTDAQPTKTATLAETLRQLGIAGATDVWMIGDRASDIEAARRCGVGAAGALWGYGKPDELRAAGADLLAETPADPLLRSVWLDHTSPANR